MLKSILIGSAVIAAIVAPLAGVSAYDRAETTHRYTIGTTWNGDRAIFAYEDGRLFRDERGENIGYFAGGRPRLVAFDCEGASAPIIAIEESDLPRCGRIETIEGAAALNWAD